MITYFVRITFLYNRKFSIDKPVTNSIKVQKVLSSVNNAIVITAGYVVSPGSPVLRRMCKLSRFCCLTLTRKYFTL